MCLGDVAEFGWLVPDEGGGRGLAAKNLADSC